MKLSDIDRKKIEELAGDDGVPEGIISDGVINLDKLNKWIALQEKSAATYLANWTDEDEQKYCQKISKLVEFINEPEPEDENRSLSDEEMAACKAEDREAHQAMIADGIDLFRCENSLSIDIAKMIINTLVPNILLKEEIALLKTEEGQNYMFSRMYKVAKWRKCECY
jgi:hypothetical protein